MTVEGKMRGHGQGTTLTALDEVLTFIPATSVPTAALGILLDVEYLDLKANRVTAKKILVLSSRMPTIVTARSAAMDVLHALEFAASASYGGQEEFVFKYSDWAVGTTLYVDSP